MLYFPVKVHTTATAAASSRQMAATTQLFVFFAILATRSLRPLLVPVIEVAARGEKRPPRTGTRLTSVRP